MIKVRVKGEGVKLANRWCFINDEATIDEEEFERNKEYVNVIEKIKEVDTTKNQTSEVDSGEDQNPKGNNGEDTGENNKSEDEELEALKERAKKLGIKNTHNMKKETLIAKIQETEEASAGEDQNPKGE